MASNLIASSGTKLAAVGAQGVALSRLRSFTPKAGYVLPVAVQGGASFPLRLSAAIRVSLLPQRAKIGDSREDSDKERAEYEHGYGKESTDPCKCVKKDGKEIKPPASLGSWLHSVIMFADIVYSRLGSILLMWHMAKPYLRFIPFIVLLIVSTVGVAAMYYGAVVALKAAQSTSHSA